LYFRCESLSHQFLLFYFETGSLVGFVILELPRFFLQRARKLGCFGGCGDGDSDGNIDGCSECNGDGSDDGGGRGNGDSQR
jgi:hypothetical protein